MITILSVYRGEKVRTSLFLNEEQLYNNMTQASFIAQQGNVSILKLTKKPSKFGHMFCCICKDLKLFLHSYNVTFVTFFHVTFVAAIL